MFTKRIVIIIIYFITLNTTIVLPISFHNSTYCPKEALIILNKTTSVGINCVSTPAIQHNSNNTINVNENDEVMCPCLNKTCIPICCPHGHEKIARRTCIPIIRDGINNWKDIYFPQIHDSKNLQALNELHFNFNNLTVNPKYYDDYIHIFIRDPCSHKRTLRLNPKKHPEHEFKLLDDGSIIVKNGYPISLNDYCLGIFNAETYGVVLCLDPIIDDDDNGSEYYSERSDFQSSLNAGMFISLPFLFVTFIVYSIIPELKNVHGFTLRHYISFLFITYATLAVVRTCVAHNIHFSDRFCITVAFIVQFSFLSSFFWLNVMCFDIWWTFRGFRGLQGTVKRRERKKYVTYSIYAWGGASFFTAICFIVDFMPELPSYFIRPQFGSDTCGYISDLAAGVYFYPPMGMIIICNTYFFISTARKIVRHKKELANQLNSTNSRRHDDHEQRFNLYLKLFIVMGINWSMELILWILAFAPDYIWYITDLTNSLQGVIIFITFVWEDKVKRLILRYLGINAPIRTQSRNSTKKIGCNKSELESKVVVPLREQNSLHHICSLEPKHSPTTFTDESDYV